VCKREYTGREIYAIYGILCHSVFWNGCASSKHGGNEMVGERKKRGGEKRVIINPPRYSQGLRTGIHNHHQLYHILYQFVNPHCVLWGMAQRGKENRVGYGGDGEKHAGCVAHASTPHDGEPMLTKIPNPVPICQPSCAIGVLREWNSPRCVSCCTRYSARRKPHLFASG